MKRIAVLTAFMLACLFVSTSFADRVTTIAGGGINLPAVGLTGTDVEIGDNYSAKVDSDGNLYLANYPNAVSSLWFIRIDKWGKIDRLFENFTTPVEWFDDICVDGAGNVFLPGFDESVVFKVTPEGNTSIFAGNGTFGYSGDGGPATSAQLERPESVIADANGNIYITHYSTNPVIRMVDKAGIITTVFDGTALGLQTPDAVYVANNGAIYFAAGQKVFRYSQGIATEISAELGHIRGLTGDKYGNIFYSSLDYGSGTKQTNVKKISPFGIVSVLMGEISQPDAPTRLSADKDGMLYITKYQNPTGSTIKKIAFTPVAETILPLDATPGTRLTISGRYFGSNGIGGSVTFGGIAAPIHSWSNDLIVCDIPANASKSTVSVVVTAVDGQTSNVFSYRIR